MELYDLEKPWRMRRDHRFVAMHGASCFALFSQSLSREITRALEVRDGIVDVKIPVTSCQDARWFGPMGPLSVALPERLMAPLLGLLQNSPLSF
jgi:hypothetical protein